MARTCILQCPIETPESAIHHNSEKSNCANNQMIEQVAFEIQPALAIQEENPTLTHIHATSCAFIHSMVEAV